VSAVSPVALTNFLCSYDSGLRPSTDEFVAWWAGAAAVFYGSMIVLGLVSATRNRRALEGEVRKADRGPVARGDEELLLLDEELEASGEPRRPPTG